MASMADPIKLPAKVFISHSHHDTRFCEGLAEGLRAVGIGVWLDEDSMTLNHTIPQSIGIELAGCALFLVVLSAAACNSQWVKLEIDTALALHKSIVVASVEHIENLPASMALLEPYKRVPFWTIQLADGLKQILALFELTSSQTEPLIYHAKGHGGPAFEAQWSQSEACVASVGADGFANVWHGPGYRQCQCLNTSEGPSDWLTRVMWSPDDQYLITGGVEDTVYIWAVSTHRLSQVLPSHGGTLRALAWYDDGPRVVYDDGRVVRGGVDGWEWLSDQRGTIYTAKWAWRTPWLAYDLGDGSVCIQNSRLISLHLEEGQVKNLAWDRADSRVAVVTNSGRIHICDAHKGAWVGCLDTGRPQAHSVCWAPSGDRLIVGGTDGLIQIYVIHDGAKCMEVDTKYGPVSYLSMAPTKPLLCSTHETGTIAFWNLSGILDA